MNILRNMESYALSGVNFMAYELEFNGSVFWVEKSLRRAGAGRREPGGSFSLLAGLVRSWKEVGRRTAMWWWRQGLLMA